MSKQLSFLEDAFSFVIVKEGNISTTVKLVNVSSYDISIFPSLEL